MEVVFLWCVLPPLSYMTLLAAIAAQKSDALLFTALAAAILIPIYGVARVYIMICPGSGLSSLQPRAVLPESNEGRVQRL